MSVAGIASSSLFSYLTQNVQGKRQQFKQEFQQLGQDLQSGNLTAAQSDLAALQQNAPQGSSVSSTTSSSIASSSNTNSIGQEFKQLSQDLQSGDLSAAQQDYATIQQDFQSQATQGQAAQGHHHHHHHGGWGGSSSDSSSNAISQLFNELGSALQSGNLTNAQQAYSTLQQDLLQFTAGGTSSSNTAAPQGGSSGVSVSV